MTIINYYTLFSCSLMKKTENKICSSVLLSKRHQQGKYVLLSFCQNDISKEKCSFVLLSKRHQQGKMSFCPSVKTTSARKYVLLSFCQNVISKENMSFCPSVKTTSARKNVLSVLLSKRHQQGNMSFCPSVKFFKAFCLNIKNTCLCQR